MIRQLAFRLLLVHRRRRSRRRGGGRELQVRERSFFILTFIGIVALGKMKLFSSIKGQ